MMSMLPGDAHDGAPPITTTPSHGSTSSAPETAASAPVPLPAPTAMATAQACRFTPSTFPSPLPMHPMLPPSITASAAMPPPTPWSPVPTSNMVAMQLAPPLQPMQMQQPQMPGLRTYTTSTKCVSSVTIDIHTAASYRVWICDTSSWRLIFQSARI